MNPNKINNSSPNTLTRSQKLLRRAAPLALLAAGVSVGAGVAANKLSQDNEAPRATAAVTSHATAETKIGGTESGWGQGAAEKSLINAIYEGAAHSFADIQAKDASFSLEDGELESLVEELPTYDESMHILDMAGYQEVVIDKGDQLKIEVEVTANADKVITFEVTDAHIEDRLNNQG